MKAHLFGTLGDGTPIHEVVIGRPGGVQATVMEFGAVIRDIVVPLPAGGRQHVALGLTNLEDYVHRSPYFGALAGRYANRIGQGRFTLNGQTHQLNLNQDGRHTLHGGAGGVGKRAWRILGHDSDSVTLGIVSQDGDQGFPGTMSITCVYRIEGGMTLRMELTASTDAPTVVNLCQHSYFNLDGAKTVLDHVFQVDSGFHTPNDLDLIPTGEIRSIEGTPLDFREPRPLRHPALENGFFYDHNFPLRRTVLAPSGRADTPDLARAATVWAKTNGIVMEVWTTEPALQVYAGHKLAMTVPGLGGEPYGPHAGLALEPQHFPDSPNKPHFPSTVLRPGGVYAQVSEYRFATA